MLFSVAHGSDVLAWLIASECYSARIITVSLNTSPANYSNAGSREALKHPFCPQEQVEIPMSVLRGVFETAHKT